MAELAIVAITSCVCVLLLSGLAGQKHAVIPRPKLRLVRTRSVPGEREVPGMLDIVTLGLEAGLSFDAALELYCERYEGRLARALASTMLGWRLGAYERSEGLRRVAKTADAPSLVEVAAVVEEALELGLPLADTLTRQADAIRIARRAMVEERIERVPVKMLIPLGTLIVPAMLLAILGPLLGSVLRLG